MGSDLTQQEFVEKRKPSLLRRGKAWTDGKIGLK